MGEPLEGRDQGDSGQPQDPSGTVAPLSAQELELCLSLLQRVADTHKSMPENERLYSLITKVHREGRRRRREKRTLRKRDERRQDQALRATARLVQQQSDLALPAGEPTPARLNRPENCYICKQPYRDVHFFYHYLCPECAAFNYTMRSLSADLTGRTALVTGGRVKIGHQLVLRLLRDGARVLVTTRFPRAAAARFAAEPDSPQWRQRLQIFGLDLRNLPAVEEFAHRLCDSEPELDILIHNAAQTIKRPLGFYRELVEQELAPAQALPAPVLELVAQGAPETLTVYDSQQLLTPTRDVLPVDRLHDWEERADSRTTNSWMLPLEAVGTAELLEVQLVNAIAPFVLNARLKPLLLRSRFARRFIVNVSAMEGQFSRHKTEFHPHTNMAKAALNMLTHTSAAAYARDGIYMNSVDTGWVTDENPTPRRLRKQEELGFYAPLDSIDGMARIYHPVALGVDDAQTPMFGLFLKDYAACKW